MPEYTNICMNMPNLREWFLFYISPLSKRPIDCFFEEPKFDFSIAAGNIWLCLF